MAASNLEIAHGWAPDLIPEWALGMLLFMALVLLGGLAIRKRDWSAFWTVLLAWLATWVALFVINGICFWFALNDVRSPGEDYWQKAISGLPAAEQVKERLLPTSGGAEKAEASDGAEKKEDPYLIKVYWLTARVRFEPRTVEDVLGKTDNDALRSAASRRLQDLNDVPAIFILRVLNYGKLPIQFMTLFAFMAGMIVLVRRRILSRGSMDFVANLEERAVHGDHEHVLTGWVSGSGSGDGGADRGERPTMQAADQDSLNLSEILRTSERLLTGPDEDAYSAAQVSAVHSTFLGLCDEKREQIDLAHEPVDYLKWALPATGFTGTVVGMGVALGESHQLATADGTADLEKAIKMLAGQLGTAFDTTLLALVLSFPLVFCAMALRRREHGMLVRLQRLHDVALAFRQEGYRGTSSTL